MREIPFSIGKWHVDPGLNRMVLNGQVVRLEPRLMKLLVLLAENQGAVISKDNLLDKTWEGINVSEESLTQAISQIRKILALDSSTEVFIQTVSKKGYLLVPEVHPLQTNPIKKVTLGLAAAGLLVVLFFAGLHERFLGGTPPFREAVSVLPITSQKGRERDPDVSSDGSMVVYSSVGADGLSQIYLHARSAGAPDRRLTDAGNNFSPVFFPDDKKIAFLRKDETGCRIIFYDLLGQGERVAGSCLSNQYPDLAMNDSGSALAFSSRGGDNSPNAIFYLSSRDQIDIPDNLSPGRNLGRLRPGV